MATRRQIREAFYSELESAVPSSGSSGHVAADRIQNERPEADEDPPRIVHDDNYRKRPINQASAAPTRVEYDQNGDWTGTFYSTLHEARFDVLFWFADESEKEDCYEAVRSYFEKYEHPAWDASSIQADAKWVRVRDAQSDDDADIDPVRRGDRLIISIVFLREQEDADGEPIDTVNTELDADDDGTTDLTWSSS